MAQFLSTYHIPLPHALNLWISFTAITAVAATCGTAFVQYLFLQTTMHHTVNKNQYYQNTATYFRTKHEIQICARAQKVRNFCAKKEQRLVSISHSNIDYQ
jgi:hypothetical protein